MPRQLPWNQPRQPDFEDLNGTNNLDFIDLISNDGLDDEPIDYDSDGLEEPDGDDFWPNSELVLAYRERRALARQTASGMVPVNPPRLQGNSVHYHHDLAANVGHLGHAVPATPYPAPAQLPSSSPPSSSSAFNPLIRPGYALPPVPADLQLPSISTLQLFQPPLPPRSPPPSRQHLTTPLSTARFRQ